MCGSLSVIGPRAVAVLMMDPMVQALVYAGVKVALVNHGDSDTALGLAVCAGTSNLVTSLVVSPAQCPACVATRFTRR